MKQYKKLLAYVPYSSIEQYGWGRNRFYQTDKCTAFQLFDDAKKVWDCHLDLLFGLSMKGVEMCRFPYSSFFMDADLDFNGNPDSAMFWNVCTDLRGNIRKVPQEDMEYLRQIYKDFVDGVNDALVDRTLVLECKSHSWKNHQGMDMDYSGGDTPDVILGYFEGDTQPDEDLVNYVSDQFAGHGYKVEVSCYHSNDGFKGNGMHQHDRLNISLSRGMYMDEETLKPKYEDCNRIREIMAGIYRHVLDDCIFEEKARKYVATKLKTPVFEDSSGAVGPNIGHEEYQYRFGRMVYNVESGLPLAPEIVKIALRDDDYIYILAQCIKDSAYSFNKLTQDNPRLAADICKKLGCLSATTGGDDKPYLLFFDEAIEDAKSIRDGF